MLGRLKLDIDEIIKEKLSKIPVSVWKSKTTTFCDLQMGGGQYIKAIVKKLREFGYSDENIKRRVYGFSENELYLSYVLSDTEIIGTFDIYRKDINMKFDVIVGNPPFSKTVGPNKTEAIWNKFVENSIELLSNGGYLGLIHPNSWRQFDGGFSNIKELLTRYELLYLETHDYEDGFKLFGVRTSYDWYILRKNVIAENNTTIQFKDKLYVGIDVNKLPFIPTGDFDILLKILPNTDDEMVNVLYSSSDYEIRYKHMNKQKTNQFIYPCVYSITKGTGINLYYSSTKENGHFGIPKVIWSNGKATYPILDIDGKYGLTQFSYAIIDNPENLENIQRVLNSEKFIQFMSNVKLNDGKYDRRVISTFKKDFWKEFIDD